MSAGSSSASAAELATLIRERAAPGVFCVFDLDRTLWDGDCQSFSTPDTLALYPDVSMIVAALSLCEIPWAVASANPNKRRCLWLLEAHGLLRSGQAAPAEIFPGGKKPHLERVRRAIQRPAAAMLFFDDLLWNIREAEKQGGVAVHLSPPGLSIETLLAGLSRHREHRRAVTGQQAGMKRWLQAAPASQPGAKRAVSHDAALATLRTVTNVRDDVALEALLARHSGDPAAAAASYFDDPRLEPANAEKL